jgi:hypothetical protein
MSRPFFKCSIETLEREFSERKSDAEFLEVLRDSLSIDPPTGLLD